MGLFNFTKSIQESAKERYDTDTVEGIRHTLSVFNNIEEERKALIADFIITSANRLNFNLDAVDDGSEFFIDYYRRDKGMDKEPYQDELVAVPSMEGPGYEYKKFQSSLALEGMEEETKNTILNFDKWKSNNYNILYITGLSGSGKSTLSRQYASKYNAEVFELDGIETGKDTTKSKILDEVKERVPAYKKAIEEGKCKDPNIEFKVLHEAISIMKSKKNTKFIVEGFQIFDLCESKDEIKFYMDKPLIIIDVDIKEAARRAYKRDNKKDISKSDLEKYLLKYASGDSKLKSFKKVVNESSLEDYLQGEPEEKIEEVPEEDKGHNIIDDDIEIPEVVNEEDLSTKQRNELDDQQFGIPSLRKYPLTDANHVRSAISYFSKCPPEYKSQLAKAIRNKAKKYGVEISKDSDVMNESFIFTEGTMCIGEAVDVDGCLKTAIDTFKANGLKSANISKKDITNFKEGKKNKICIAGLGNDYKIIKKPISEIKAKNPNIQIKEDNYGTAFMSIKEQAVSESTVITDEPNDYLAYPLDHPMKGLYKPLDNVVLKKNEKGIFVTTKGNRLSGYIKVSPSDLAVTDLQIYNNSDAELILEKMLQYSVSNYNIIKANISNASDKIKEIFESVGFEQRKDNDGKITMIRKFSVDCDETILTESALTQVFNENYNPNYKRKYKCPYCAAKLDKEKLMQHIIDEHEDLIPEGYTTARLVFNVANKKETGHCVECKHETKWNENTWRYERFCSKACQDKYTRTAKDRMIKKYGKEHILNDPEHQNKMLANRKISGTYKMTDGGEKSYVGSYEKNSLEFYDEVLGMSSNDIITPGPTIEYEMNGEKHFWITDQYLAPFNLVIDVKDGGENPNKAIVNRDRQAYKEAAIKKQGKYNYLRLTDNNFAQLLEVMMEFKKQMIDHIEDNRIVKINEYMAMGALNPMVGIGVGNSEQIDDGCVFMVNKNKDFVYSDPKPKYYKVNKEKKVEEVTVEDMPKLLDGKYKRTLSEGASIIVSEAVDESVIMENESIMSEHLIDSIKGKLSNL